MAAAARKRSRPRLHQIRIAQPLLNQRIRKPAIKERPHRQF
jgi:hypothetical protein